MPAKTVSIAQRSTAAGTAVLLASPDTALIFDLQRILRLMGMRIEAVTCGSTAMTAMESLEDTAIVLLDVRLAGVASGQLLEAIRASGARRRCAIALVAESISDEWIGWLREGAIDDIVPRNADAMTWRTHLSAMQRGHRLYCELEQLREAAVQEVQYDRTTGAIHRESMLTLLFRETDRVQRLHGSLSLVLFSVDNFASWIKELGRLGCDHLLLEVAARTRRMLRSYDLLGRTGQQEFLVALPGCSIQDAAMMAERLRVEVFGEPFLVRDIPGREGEEAFPIRLTACFGVTASRGRSPIVVLHEVEQTLEIGRSSAPDSIRCTNEPADSGGCLANLDAFFPEVEVLA